MIEIHFFHKSKIADDGLVELDNCYNPAVDCPISLKFCTMTDVRKPRTTLWDKSSLRKILVADVSCMKPAEKDPTFVLKPSNRRHLAVMPRRDNPHVSFPLSANAGPRTYTAAQTLCAANSNEDFPHFLGHTPAQSLSGKGGGRNLKVGGHMASVEHESIMGVWGRSPVGSGAEPLVRGSLRGA